VTWRAGGTGMPLAELWNFPNARKRARQIITRSNDMSYCSGNISVRM
jgi:hypothetical protein